MQDRTFGKLDWDVAPSPPEYWDQQAFLYASGEGQRRYGRFLQLYEESCWRYIEPILPEAGAATILEAGCGTGRWVFRLAPLGYRVMLSDLSPEMIRHAQEKVERLGLDDRVAGYHVLDICNMHTLPKGSFDLVLALGGPLTLCRDAGTAVNEFHRVTRQGGYVICDVANQYRTALNLTRDGWVGQLGKVLDTGEYSRPDGLFDHRFSPQKLADLFAGREWEVRHVAGICPFFDFLPTKEAVSILDDEQVYQLMRKVSSRYAEDPAVVGLSGRLLIVARRQDPNNAASQET